MLTENTNRTEKNVDADQWFDKMVCDLRIDQLLMQTEVLEKHKRELYDAMISGNDEFMHDYARKTSTVFFIKNLINSFFLELGGRRARPKRLALELSDSKILLWAEIENDDEVTEDALILSAAKVNYDFSKYGFHVSSTIVEEGDGLDIPEHYKEVTIK